MTRLIWETIKERKWSLVIYSGVSILMLLLYVAMFPSLKSQSQQLTEVLKTMPADLLKALGSSPEQLSNFTLEALLASKQFSIFFQIIAAVLAISIAGSDIAAEIEKGTIEFLLSQPISRLKFYFARYLSGTILITIFVASSTILVIPLATAFKVDYNAGIYWKLLVDGWLFTMAFYAASYFLSAIFSSKGRVSAITAGLLVVMYALFLISALKENLDKLKYLSFFHYFPGDLMFSGKFDQIGIWVFAIIIIVFTILGAAAFNKRDIAIS